MRVSAGDNSIMLTEDAVKRLQILSCCDYMPESIDKVIRQIVTYYQESCSGPDIDAKDAMEMISLLMDIKDDYLFLLSLRMEDEEE